MAYVRDGETITFSYTSQELMNAFLETGERLVPFEQDGDPETIIAKRTELFPFVEERDEVSLDFIQRLFVNAVSPLYSEMRELMPVSSDSGADISDGITLVIRDSGRFKDTDVSYVDAYAFNSIVFGAIHGWFKTKGYQSIIEQTSKMVADATASAAATIRDMIQNVNRPQLRNPFGMKYFENEDC